MKPTFLVLLCLCLTFAVPVMAEDAAPQVSPDIPVAPEPGDFPDLMEPDSMSCSAETTCSSGVVISCTASGTSQCNSFSDRVECGDSGTGSCSVECGPVNSYEQCRDACEANFQACLNNCPDPTSRLCGQPCYTERFQCILACGSAPATSCSV